MSKRSLEEIVKDILPDPPKDFDKIINDKLPEQSKDIYNRKWEEFKAYVSEQRKPEEADYMQYFDYLHTEKKLKASSIWSTYSMLNAVHQREFKEKLQKFTRVTQLLKSYNSSYVRKVASVFDEKSIEDYLNLRDSTPFVLVRKSIIAISVAGGLKTWELRRLDVADIVKKGDIYEVNIQKSEKQKSMFIVPPSLAIHIKNYLVALAASRGELSGPFIKGTPKCRKTGKSKFSSQPMGKNVLYGVGKDVASQLGLENPDSYTTHCFCKMNGTLTGSDVKSEHIDVLEDKCEERPKVCRRKRSWTTRYGHNFHKYNEL